MEIRQIIGAIFLYTTIAGYLFLGVGILVNVIFRWTGGGRRAHSMARDMKRPAELTRNARKWGNGWMPKISVDEPKG